MSIIRKLLPRFSLRTLVIFPLLVTSAVALWLHWEPWYLCVARTDLACLPARFTDNGVRFEVCYGDYLKTHDAQTGALLRTTSVKHNLGVVADFLDSSWKSPGEAVSCDGGRRAVAVPGPGLAVRDAKSNALLSEADDDGAVRLGRPFVIWSGDGERVLINDECTGIYVFRRRRPEWWWGIFCLWEFWLTVGFALLLSWSVWRDRRTLRPNQSM